MNDLIRLEEVRLADTERVERRAEFNQSLPDRGSIGGRRFYPDVQVTSDARHTMGSERVRTNNQEADLAVDQSREEIPEVGDHVLPA